MTYHYLSCLSRPSSHGGATTNDQIVNEYHACNKEKGMYSASTEVHEKSDEPA
jgi:hypothetical protein